MQAAAECCAPLSAPLLSHEEAEATAAVFRALSDPARVRIVNVLAASGGEVCVCELTEPLGRVVADQPELLREDPHPAHRQRADDAAERRVDHPTSSQRTW